MKGGSNNVLCTVIAITSISHLSILMAVIPSRAVFFHPRLAFVLLVSGAHLGEPKRASGHCNSVR